MVAHIKMIFVGILIFLILIGISIFCGLHISKDKAIENVINWVMESRTIGGAFIWPKTKGRRKECKSK